MKISSFCFNSALAYLLFTACCFSADEQPVRSEDFNKVMAAIQTAEKDTDSEALSAVMTLFKTFSEKFMREVVLKDPEFVKLSKEVDETRKNFQAYRNAQIKDNPKLQELADSYSTTMIELKKNPADKEKSKELKRVAAAINAHFKDDQNYIKYNEKLKSLEDLKQKIITTSTAPVAQEYRLILKEFAMLTECKNDEVKISFTDFFKGIKSKLMDSDILKLGEELITKKLKEENPEIKTEDITSVFKAIYYCENPDAGIKILTGLTDNFNDKDFSKVFLICAEKIKYGKIVHREFSKSLDKIVINGATSGNDSLMLARLAAYLYSEDEICTLAKKLETAPDADPWLKALLQGKSEIKLAWKSRGNDWASTVTKEGWKGFKAHIEKARALLTAAHKIHPEFPDAADDMITVEMGSGGISERVEWFKKAIEAQVDLSSPYNKIKRALMPRWSGSQEMLLDLGEACINDSPVPEVGLSILITAAMQTEDYRWQKFFRKPAVEKLLKIFEEKKSKVVKKNVKEKISIIQISLLISIRDYEKAAVLMAEIEKETFDKLLNTILKSDEESEMETVNSWVNYEATLNAFTGSHREKFLKIENDFLEGNPNYEKDLLDLIKSGKLSDDEKNFAIDFYGRTKLEDVMLENIADYKTAFNSAITKSENTENVKLIKKLIELGAPLNAADNKGRSPLCMAAMENAPEIFKILLDAGADINFRSKNGRTAFVWALRYELPREIIEESIKKGADVNTSDNNRWSALSHSASCSSDPEIISLLLQSGAAVDLADGDNTTPLMCAAAQENGAEKVKIFLQAGADVNAQESSGQGLTPLIAAISRNGTLETVKLLIEAGADVNKKDLKGQSPLDWAIKKKKNDIADYLKTRK